MSLENTLQNISTLFGEKFLEKFKVYRSSTLFDPTYQDLANALKKKLCPHCSRKLYANRKGDWYYCRSKVRDKFKIRNEVLIKFK